MDTNEKPVEQDFFKSDVQDSVARDDMPPTDEQSISWSASEFMHHQKSAGWYLVATLAIVFLSGISYLLVGDLISPVAVLVLGSLLLVAAGRKPRTIEFTVDSHGVVVGSKEYMYDEFQSFAVMQEDQVECITLYSQKRFAPEINMYFAPDDGQKIFDILSNYLPFEQREKDGIDKFLHKIRF